MTLQRSRTDRTFKILLIGDSSVGKTSLMFRFADDKFSESFTPTIGVDFKMKDLIVRDKNIRLQLWDTAGQEKFFNITRNYYRSADAILLVYDRTEASSFQNISRWMKCIEENAPDDVIRVLVGNKSDLHHRLVISSQDGKKLADKYHVDFYETSAKSEKSTTVSDMFYFIAEKLVDLKQGAQKISPDRVNLLTHQTNSTYDRLTSCCSFNTNN